MREVFEAGSVEGTFLHLYKYVCHSVHYTVKFLHLELFMLKPFVSANVCFAY